MKYFQLTDSLHVENYSLISMVKPIIIKDYLHYKTITSQNVSSRTWIKNFLFIERLRSILKIFKILFFNHPIIHQFCNVMMSISI